MNEWVTLHVFSVPRPDRLSVAVFSPSALRDFRTWIWMGAVAGSGFGSWLGLMRLAFFASAMHRRSVATVVLFLTMFVGLGIAALVAQHLAYMLPGS
jgi:hypothetical protein